MGAQDDFKSLAQCVNVSRETFERLKLYQNLLLKWQSKINLIGADTIPDNWQRHFIDSAQLHPLVNLGEKAIDFGTGAGFPGMVLAILGASHMHLIESDHKKIIFLREVARVTNTVVTIHHKRIEELEIPDVKTILSRACSPLKSLFSYAEKYVSRETICLLHKGKNYSQELLDSNNDWLFDYDIIPSVTDTQGALLKIANLRRRAA